MSNYSLNFSSPSDSLKLDDTASKTFNILGTGGTVTIES